MNKKKLVKLKKIYEKLGLMYSINMLIRYFFTKVLIAKNRYGINRLINVSKDYFYKKQYKFIADDEKIILISPEDVKYRLKDEKIKKWQFGRIMDGDWDKKVIDIDTDIKCSSIYDHFSKKTDWSETRLFKELYPERLKKGQVLGCNSIDELKIRYTEHIDELYQDIKKNGFLNHSQRSEEITPIYIYIGRNGEIIYSDDGNHRLIISKVLGIKEIPVKVRARHKIWQDTREKVGFEGFDFLTVNKKNISDHPDFIDLISRNRIQS